MGEIQYYTYNDSDYAYMDSKFDYRPGRSTGFFKKGSQEHAHPVSKKWQTKLVALYRKKMMGN